MTIALLIVSAVLAVLTRRALRRHRVRWLSQTLARTATGDSRRLWGSLDEPKGVFS